MTNTVIYFYIGVGLVVALLLGALWVAGWLWPTMINIFIYLAIGVGVIAVLLLGMFWFVGSIGFA